MLIVGILRAAAVNYAMVLVVYVLSGSELGTGLLFPLLSHIQENVHVSPTRPAGACQGLFGRF